MKSEESRLRETVSWLSGGTKTDIKRAEAAAARDRDRILRELPKAFLTGEGHRFASLATKKLANTGPDLLQYLESIADRFVAAEECHRAAHAASLAEAALTLRERRARTNMPRPNARAACSTMTT